MSSEPALGGARRLLDLYHRSLRALVRTLGPLSCAGLMAMVLITCADFILRAIGMSFAGA